MRHQIAFKVFAAILIVVGYFIRYWIKGRKFRRRNVAGLQVFPSYFSAVFTRFWEGTFLVTGGLLIFIGVVLFLWTLM